MEVLRGLLGVAVLLGTALLLSEDRRRFNWRLTAGGLILQLLLALAFLREVPGIRSLFDGFARAVVTLLDHSAAGARFVFGPLADANLTGEAFGGGRVIVFAFQVLPVIVFFSALTSLLYYLGVLQKFVAGFAWIMRRAMGLSGPESLAAAGNVFLGMTEAPLLVKPYIAGMTRSELMALMTGGMATIAGSVMLAYIAMLGGDDPAQKERFAGFLLCASLMNAPASLVVAKILVPRSPGGSERATPRIRVAREDCGVNVWDAVVRGTAQGLHLAFNVAAMLIVFVALISLCNGLLQWLGSLTGLGGWMERATGGIYSGLTLEGCAGLLFAPVAWVIGIPVEDMIRCGQLLGTKIIANEYLAYQQLGLWRSEGLLGERSLLLITFALCGFANIASVGIQIGGIGVLAPERREDLARLGAKALAGGFIASLLSAAVVGMVI
ncbi:MAG TPA: nucleoside transporter C-terminal domain-containing protein [Verrucomicrobiales bacterium]|nr:nucleoside transporter C-terminal domain-containing protein [Verrucomicrobiales bacterium]